MRRLSSVRVALVMCFVVFGSFVLAQSAEQLETDIRTYDALLEQRRQDAADIETALSASGEALRARVAERATVSDELAALQTELSALLTDIAALNERITATDAQMAQLDRKLDALKLRVQGLLLNLFTQRGNRVGDALSQAQSFHDLQVKNYYLSLLSEQDVGLINDLDATVEELLTLQEVQQGQLGSLNVAKEQVSVNTAEREAKRGELDDIIADLNQTQQGQLALQGAVLEEQAALETRLGNLAAALAQEQARLAEQARLEREARERENKALAAISARNAERAPPAPSETPRPAALELPPLASGYAYPVDAPKLVSAYGEKNIAGVWLQAPEPGAPVVAVQPGVVAAVGFATANQGYVVQLQHADGLVTAYVNLQAGAPVEGGQTVAQGQVIGYLGGGGIIPSDVLELHTGWLRNGRVDWTDPAKLLGF